jgi:hypothetical protein
LSRALALTSKAPVAATPSGVPPVELVWSEVANPRDERLRRRCGSGLVGRPSTRFLPSEGRGSGRTILSDWLRSAAQGHVGRRREAADAANGALPTKVRGTPDGSSGVVMPSTGIEHARAEWNGNCSCARNQAKPAAASAQRCTRRPRCRDVPRSPTAGARLRRPSGHGPSCVSSQLARRWCSASTVR